MSVRFENYSEEEVLQRKEYLSKSTFEKWIKWTLTNKLGDLLDYDDLSDKYFCYLANGLFNWNSYDGTEFECIIRKFLTDTSADLEDLYTLYLNSDGNIREKVPTPLQRYEHPSDTWVELSDNLYMAIGFLADELGIRFCEDCGMAMYDDDVYWDDDYPYCERCYSNNHSSSDYVYDYHCGDSHIKYTCIGEGNRFFGCEIETEGGKDNAEIVHDQLSDLVTMEDDGSLDNGFEIITAPQSLDKWKENAERFRKCFTTLTNNGQRSHDTSTCGLHIHISRSAFKNRTAIMRFSAIINYFKNNVEKIARRSSNGYANYNGLYAMNSIRKNDNLLSRDHYSVVSCGHDETIEVRAFKGTLNMNTILASIEFLNNCVDMANDSKKIRFKFSELISGEFLPEYATSRGVDMDKYIDFTAWDIDKVKERLLTKKRLQRAKYDLDMQISDYNNDCVNWGGVKICA